MMTRSVTRSLILTLSLASLGLSAACIEPESSPRPKLGEPCDGPGAECGGWARCVEVVGSDVGPTCVMNCLTEGQTCGGADLSGICVNVGSSEGTQNLCLPACIVGNRNECEYGDEFTCDNTCYCK